MDLIKLTAIGHLAAPPEIGHGTVKLSLVATYLWADKKARPVVVVVYVQGKLAEICGRYLKQGSRVYCEAHQERDGFVADGIILLGAGRQPRT